MEQYLWVLDVFKKLQALQLSDFFLFFLARANVLDNWNLLKCINDVAVHADSGNNPYARFVSKYFHTMDGYLACVQHDLEILEGLFWYFNHAASFSSPEIAASKDELMWAIWEGLEAGTWQEFLDQHHYEREYSLTFLSLDPWVNNNTAVAAYPPSTQPQSSAPKGPKFQPTPSTVLETPHSEFHPSKGGISFNFSIFFKFFKFQAPISRVYFSQPELLAQK